MHMMHRYTHCPWGAKKRAHTPDLAPQFTLSYISFFMDRVRVLQAAGVHPVLVFDGGRLPAKAGEEGTRQR